MVAEAEQGEENVMVGIRFATSMVMRGTAELLAYFTVCRVPIHFGLLIGAVEGKSIVGIQPPDQFPNAVWEELVRQGRLKSAGRGFYQLAE